MNRQEVAKKLIVNDIENFLDIFFSCDQCTRIYLMLGGITYVSMIINEALTWCERQKIQVNKSTNRELIEKMRAKVKLYSGDSKISLNVQKASMSDIILTEKQYWIEKHAESEKWCPKFLIPDIGAFKVENYYIGNTLEYAYEYSPMNPKRIPILNAVEKNIIYDYSVTIGDTMGKLYSALSHGTYSLRNHKSASINVTEVDFRMDNRSFFKNENSIYAFNLYCRINYLLELLLPLSSKHPFLSFRMIYITFYHLYDDLNNLGLNFVYYKMPYKNVDFRNAMAHYSLYGKIEDKEIIENVIGFGLLEKFFGESFETVNHIIIEELKKTRDSLKQFVKI